MARKLSLEVGGGLNPWYKKPTGKADAPAADSKKRKHRVVKPEFRYWFGERFSGHFLGAQLFYVDFDIHGYKIPRLLPRDAYNEGTALGGGFSYGYHWALSRHWGLEFNVAAGLMQVDYLEKECDTCSEGATRYKKTYIGPTAAGIKVVFLIK